MNKTFWKNKRVLITGCTGFVGSWLTAVLLDLNADVTGLIRDNVPQSELFRTGNHNRINIVYGDLSSYEMIERFIAEYEIEIIFHLASQTIVGIANRAPLSTFETNIRGTYLLLEAARRNNTVKGIVVASSLKVYGDQPTLPYTEDMPMLGFYPYDVSKSCADLLSQSYAHTYKMPIIITRCANLYGGGDLSWNRIVPGTMRSVLQGDRPIIRSDGTFKRDYLYVKDAIRGYLMAAEHVQNPENRGEAYNFGMSGPVTALELVKTIIAVSDKPNTEPIILDEVRDEIKDQYFSSCKAEKELGWVPQYSLKDGLAETMAWYREFLESE